jgi:hypothetical protein
MKYKERPVVNYHRRLFCVLPIATPFLSHIHLAAVYRGWCPLSLFDIPVRKPCHGDPSSRGPETLYPRAAARSLDIVG